MGGSPDTTLRNLDFEFLPTVSAPPSHPFHLLHEEKVVEVQHGESWADYRPARPQDFVGRSDVQNRIVQFFESVRGKSTGTRVFAITGDSGMGKSSLVAKLREKTSNIRHRNKFFLYAVDVRAATGSDYILWSLLACIRAASLRGFGTTDGEPVKITDYNQPLASDTIRKFLDRLEQREQVVVGS